ncbi:hypothetical protein ACJX0J_023817, partial [Zea mays]
MTITTLIYLDNAPPAGTAVMDLERRLERCYLDHPLADDLLDEYDIYPILVLSLIVANRLEGTSLAKSIRDRQTQETGGNTEISQDAEFSRPRTTTTNIQDMLEAVYLRSFMHILQYKFTRYSNFTVIQISRKSNYAENNQETRIDMKISKFLHLSHKD